MINITNTHWLLACVFLEDKRVQMYDSMPDKMDDRWCWLHRIKKYLAEEYRHIYDQDLPGADEWVYRTCPFGNKLAPVQCAGSNDCGVHLCFFMELLMNGLLPELLIGLEGKVTRYGRDALWSAIQGKNHSSRCPQLRTCICLCVRTLPILRNWHFITMITKKKRSFVPA